MSFWQQFKWLFIQGLTLDRQDKDRLFSPLLFAASLLILFAFATGELPEDSKLKVFTAEILLVILISLQGLYLRLFSHEESDGAFVLLRTYPISYQAIFLAKFFLCLIMGSLIIIPALILTSLFHNIALDQPSLYLTCMLVLIALSSLGILLSAMTLKSSGREILFPLLYFLLSSPVLLAASQSLLQTLQNSADQTQAWIVLLVGCDIIYFTLGVTLIEDLFTET